MTDDDTAPAFTIDTHALTGEHGPIPIRVYRAENGQIHGGVVWVHGGAFIGGDLNMPESDWVARQFAAAGMVVITVDYRLAPIPDWMSSYIPARPTGWRFPVASEEVSTAFEWATTSDPAVPGGRWLLGGASAGANLAAGAALRIRDSGAAAPAGLVLAYPLVHSSLPTMHAELLAKCETLSPQARFTPETVSGINLNYVGDPTLLDHPYAFPGGHDLHGLPPTIIVNSDVDSLRASGQAFAGELAGAGIDVTVVREPGTVHGHLNEPEAVGAHRSMGRLTQWVRSLLAAD
jgi:acetyl esterase